MISVTEMICEKVNTTDVFIPEVLLSARAMNAALPVLEPCLASGKEEVTGVVVIPTVLGGYA